MRHQRLRLAFALAGILLTLPLLAEEPEADWISLFDGESLNGWRGYDSLDIPPGWRVVDGTIHFSDGKGDLVTTSEFSDFELALEWKVSDGGNSGIFYLAPLGFDAIYMGAPEMQVLDDAKHRDGGDPLTSAGAAYGLYPARRGVVKPAGDWNHVRIRVLGNDVEHWLNGQRIVAYTLGSAEWRKLVRDSKFNEWPMYGMARRGHIGLQDHGDPVWYRNLRIRPLE
jgi:hypothetical protein